MKKQREDLSFLLPIREFADRGTKWLLEFGENVEGLLQIVASDLAEQLNFSQLQQVNQSFIPDNLRKQESDVIYRIPFQSEDLGDVWVYLTRHETNNSRILHSTRRRTRGKTRVLQDKTRSRSQAASTSL